MSENPVLFEPNSQAQFLTTLLKMNSRGLGHWDTDGDN